MNGRRHTGSTREKQKLQLESEGIDEAMCCPTAWRAHQGTQAAAATPRSNTTQTVVDHISGMCIVCKQRHTKLHIWCPTPTLAFRTCHRSCRAAAMRWRPGLTRVWGGADSHLDDILAQVHGGRHLEGPRAGHHAGVVNGVLHGAQAIPDGLLDLRQAVVRGPLRASRTFRSLL